MWPHGSASLSQKGAILFILTFDVTLGNISMDKKIADFWTTKHSYSIQSWFETHIKKLEMKTELLIPQFPLAAACRAPSACLPQTAASFPDGCPPLFQSRAWRGRQKSRVGIKSSFWGTKHNNLHVDLLQLCKSAVGLRNFVDPGVYWKPLQWGIHKIWQKNP